MGAPQGEPGDNELDKLGKRFERGVQSMGRGAEQIAQGQVSRGAQNLLSGTQITSNYGFEMPGQLPNEVEGEFMQGLASQANARASEAAAGAERKARLDRIQNRLKEEIRLRQKTPGKAQTLLTSSLVPNSQATGSLLTTGARR